MIFAIANDDVAIGLDGDAFESLELSVCRSPTAEGFHEDTFGVEDLDAVVAWIGNDDVALVVHRNTPARYQDDVNSRSSRIMRDFLCLPREFELCLFGALASEGGDDFAVDVEHLDAVVVRIGDDHAVGRTDGDVVRVL